MRALALLLHFYQPPTQSQTVTEQVLRSCYIPLTDLLLAHPEAQFTLNISGSLLEDIAALADRSFVEKIKILLGRNQVELANSTMYHSLLPLVPAEEIPTQLTINRGILRDTFRHEVSNVIFPPELAIKPETLSVIASEAKQSPIVIIDESSIDPNFDIDKIPKNQVFGNLVTSSRSVCELVRTYPQQLTGEKFLKFFEDRTTENQVVITVSDAEVFGHHYTERINLLRELLESKKIKFIKITDVGAIHESPVPNRAHHDAPLQASSWQTTRENLQGSNPFPMWLDPSNKLQNEYDELAKLASSLLHKSPDSNLPAERHYFRGISSCHYYWLSNWPWWHPDLVEAGALELIRCIRSLYIDTSHKAAAEKLYHEFSMKMWSYHWSGQVEQKYREYNQYREKLLESLPKI